MCAFIPIIQINRLNMSILLTVTEINHGSRKMRRFIALLIVLVIKTITAINNNYWSINDIWREVIEYIRLQTS